MYMGENVSQESAGADTQGTCGISIVGGGQNSAAFGSEQLDLAFIYPPPSRDLGYRPLKILSSLDYLMTAGWCWGCLHAGLNPVLSNRCIPLGPCWLLYFQSYFQIQLGRDQSLATLSTMLLLHGEFVAVHLRAAFICVTVPLGKLMQDHVPSGK